jgi:hypothetical protein
MGKPRTSDEGGGDWRVGWSHAQCWDRKEKGGVNANLPNPNNGIGNEDQEDDKGFHKGSDGLFTFLKPSQHLRSTGRKNNR